MQVNGGFALRWRAWECADVRGCCRQGCRPLGFGWPTGSDQFPYLGGCPYPGLMSTMREELHELIDRLPESQVAPILAIVRESTPAEDGGEEWPLPDFVGALSSGKGDLGARSGEILRAELGRDAE